MRTQVKSGNPVSQVLPNGLIDVYITTSSAVDLIHDLSARMRATAYPNLGLEPVKGFGFKLQAFEDIHRMSRMCYSMMTNSDGETTIISNLSKEDVEILFNLNTWNAKIPRILLERLLASARPGGPIGIIEADLIAKELTTILES